MEVTGRNSGKRRFPKGVSPTRTDAAKGLFLHVFQALHGAVFLCAQCRNECEQCLLGDAVSRAPDSTRSLAEGKDIVTAAELIDAAKGVLGEFTLSNDYFRAGNVAAALLSGKGQIYTGICIDVACGIGFCAEHAAIAEMLKHRETEIAMIVAVSKDKVLPPCGRCRELMFQIDHGNVETQVVLSDNEIVTLNELLPYRFH